MDKNDVRNSLNKMRNAQKGIVYESDKTLKTNNHDMKTLIGRMRKHINEAEEERAVQKTTTALDKNKEEEKLHKYFEDLEVTVELVDFEVFDKGAFLSGVIDGQVTFTITVTDSEETSGLEWSSVESFDTGVKENELLIKRLESYQDEFFEYWRDNELY